MGEVIHVDLEDLVGKVLAGGFRDCLANFADDLEASYFKWVEEEEALVRADGRLYPYFE